MTKNRYKKKLIEVAIPLEAINAAAAKEKSIRHGHPSTLHLWWARRPLAACRAVLFSQLVDDPSEYVKELLANKDTKTKAEKLKKEKLAARKKRAEEGAKLPVDDQPVTVEECAIEIERQRLFKIIEDLVVWENSTNEEVLERARAEIRRCCGDELPPVYDPFSGGGSIPLEAQRLGLPAYGSDLNPVAVMIGKAMIEIPPKFKGWKPIHPGAVDKLSYRNAEGLAEDAKYYGEWMRKQAWERIGDLYPEIELPKGHGGGKATIIAWIWARTVASPDPSMGGTHVPLSSSYVLSSKKDSPAVIDVVVDRASKTYEFRIRTQGITDREIEVLKNGSRAGKAADFICAVTQTPITRDYIQDEGKAGRLGRTLMAVVADTSRGRIFVEPSLARGEQLTTKQQTLVKQARETFLSGATPTRAMITGGVCSAYGLSTWGSLFTDRQLLGLLTYAELVEEVRLEIEQDGLARGLPDDRTPLRDGGAGAKAYAEAVSVYLGLAVSRLSDIQNSLCRWESSKTQVRNLFGRQAIPMVWDYGENNIFGDAAGDYRTSLGSIVKTIERFEPSTAGSSVDGDAQAATYPPNAIISTDPPYYDNIGYADLSDFFFCWVKSSLRSIYPNLFGVISTPKTEELVATLYRHGTKEAADAFFLNGMRVAVSRMASQTSDAFPASIYYAFKQSEIEQEGISSTGWATFLQAVVEAGYAVVGTWPMRTEMANRMVAAGTNALANSVVLVCRKKDRAADSIGRAEFIRALKRELPTAIAELQAANIAPADMPQSAIGPGMGIFSRYKAVLESDDSSMTVKAALQLINKELDEYLGGIQGEFDADTRFAITWFEQNGYAAGEYGIANNIAQARGISVESVKHAGIAESVAGKVRIIKREELDTNWDPSSDQHLTVWECCQHLIQKLELNGETEAALLLKRIGIAKADAVKDLAYCLYDICSNKRKDAKEATAYNTLIAVWSELTRQAAAMPMTTGGGQIELNV